MQSLTEHAVTKAAHLLLNLGFIIFLVNHAWFMVGPGAKRLLFLPNLPGLLFIMCCYDLIGRVGAGGAGGRAGRGGAGRAGRRVCQLPVRPRAL